jgi:putative CocE/NonD family hydrolase
MRTRRDLPVPIEHEENAWIPLSDGTRLAARIWRPAGPEAAPVPGVLEYIPYRKRFGTARRDEIMHPYLAGHGYACVRADLRGSGESDGVLRDEYLQQELDDGLEVIQWLADQPWCDGSVGMMGISWGGFNALQIAALRPPALKAIVTCSSTDDRFTDDIHHMGGCLLGDNLSWASVMFSYNTMPPDPELVGTRWRAMWMQRLEDSGLWLAQWLQHQRRDEYWQHGSINQDYGAIACPVYAIGGWADGYSNAVFRMLANLRVPRRGLVGPWSHRYPHLGEPGPAVGFLQDLVRWWDRWLKGLDNGIDREPMLRAWMQDSVPPTTQYDHRPGRWIAEPGWPSDSIRPMRLPLCADGRLAAREVGEEETYTVNSPLPLGLFAGKWCSYGSGPDLAHDQRQEDGGALVFETEPLPEPIEILGAPVVRLVVAADQPVAQVAARLSDVRPDGQATRVTYGLLNLTHRGGSEAPKPLVTHRKHGVAVQMNDIAQVFPAQHRIRLSLSTSYWPLAWPSPRPVTLEVTIPGSTLILPVRPPQASDAGLPDLGTPEGAEPSPQTILEPEHHNWLVHRDLACDESVLEVIDDRGVRRLDDIDLIVGARAVERYSSVGNGVDSVRGETRWERTLRRGRWSVRTVTRTVLTSTAEEFHIDADLDAYQGDRRVYCRTWNVTVPRDLL